MKTKCPICGEEIDDTDYICPNCQIQIKDYEQNSELNTKINETTQKNNADKLEIWASINVVIILISALAFFVYSIINNVEPIIFIPVTIVMLLSGFTFYRLLMTVVDIYKEVQANCKRK